MTFSRAASQYSIRPSRYDCTDMPIGTIARYAVSASSTGFCARAHAAQEVLHVVLARLGLDLDLDGAVASP